MTIQGLLIPLTFLFIIHEKIDLIYNLLLGFILHPLFDADRANKKRILRAKRHRKYFFVCVSDIMFTRVTSAIIIQLNLYHFKNLSHLSETCGHFCHC